MPAPGWYNENAFRSYPLVFRAAGPGLLAVTGGSGAPNRILPTQTLVDAGFSYDVPGFTDPAAAITYLSRIERTDDVIELGFKTTVPGLTAQELVFRRSTTDLEWTSSTETLTIADADGVELTWDGFLVTGPLDHLLEWLDDGAVATGSVDFQIEPSATRTLAKSYVRSVTLLNQSRVQSGNPGDTASSYVPGIVVQASGMVGDLLTREGYNIAIRQDTTEQTLNFSAAVGAGMGEPCGELPRHPGEVRPEGSVFYTGGPSCAEVISALNGQHGRVIKLLGKSGVTVTADTTNPHRLFVNFGLQSAANCLPKNVIKIYIEATSPTLFEGELP